MTKYFCYELENLEPSDADMVEALSAEYAAAEYVENSDIENGEVTVEQTIMVKEEGTDNWLRYTVSMEMLPFYSAELCEEVGK